jgi:outer membrane protein OmpA-like peptidoglycan-associated protein/tetratricopeptide (TPR) repeat protein
MKIVLLISIAALFPLNATANTQKADRLFDQWEYFRAAKLYEKEATKHPDADIYFKLGECYRKMNLHEEEQAAYDKVNGYGIYSKPEFYMNYGQILRTNGMTEQSKRAFAKYSELVPSDPRGKFFSECIEIVAEDHKWDEPVSVHNATLLNTQNADLCPVLYKDGIVFTSNRKTPGRNKIYGWTGANYLDLYYAQKGIGDLDYTYVAEFGGKKIVKKFNDGPACFSKHFDTIYISRVDRDLQGKKKATLGIERNKIFMSAMKDGKWVEAVPFYLNNDAYSVANPFLSVDGSRIYFVSDMPGGYGETDIYYCNRENNGWGAPINMGPNVNTFNREKYPALDAKGNFYFSSDGYQGFGGLDICVALNNNGVLAKAIPMKSPINSPADDFGIMFLKEGKTGYITSNRAAAGMGDDDIFHFTLLTDNIDTDLVTSAYTIGYRPKVQKSNIAPRENVSIKPVLPNDILILFDFDRSQIRPDAIAHLDSVVRYMNEFPGLTLLVTGRCDCRGTSDYNLDLAERRGEATLRYLNDNGIKASRMKSEGYGINNRPNRCENGVSYSDTEHQVNRRAYCQFRGSWSK